MLTYKSNVCIINAGGAVGKALAVQLTKSIKCQLILIDSDAYDVQKCLKLVHETDADVNALALTLDLNDIEACQQCASDLASRYETIDGLIIIGNDHGHAKNIQSLTADICNHQYQLNTLSWMTFAQVFHDNLSRSNSGHIMPILPYSRKPLDNFVNAKGSMMDLAQCLADSLKTSRIHVDCIDPNRIEVSPKGILKITSLTADDIVSQVMMILDPIKKD